MRKLTRAGIALASIAMTVGLLGAPASALADTSWGGCCARVKMP